MTNSFILIHGSALSLRSNSPRDIDVIYGHDLTVMAVEQRVREWAAERGLPPDLPLDMKRQWSEWAGYVYVPTPCDIVPQYLLLEGKKPIQVVPNWKLPACLRAYGADVEKCLQAIEREGIGMIGVGEESGEEWLEGYTGCGSVALRNAVRHAPAWREIFSQLPHGQLLTALVERDPLTRGLEWVKTRSPAKGPYLVFRDGGIYTPYGNEGNIEEDVHHILFNPEYPLPHR